MTKADLAQAKLEDYQAALQDAAEAVAAMNLGKEAEKDVLESVADLIQSL